MKKCVVLMMACIVLSSFHFETDGWDLFAKVKFVPKFFKEYDGHFLVPSFDQNILQYEGKEITLKGYYLPLDTGDSNTIILSKYPYSACFFCGGAGPESVAEIVFTKKPAIDFSQIIRVKGILRLNDTNVEHLNFILEKSTLVTAK